MKLVASLEPWWMLPRLDGKASGIDLGWVPSNQSLRNTCCRDASAGSVSGRRPVTTIAEALSKSVYLECLYFISFIFGERKLFFLLCHCLFSFSFDILFSYWHSLLFLAFFLSQTYHRVSDWYAFIFLLSILSPSGTHTFVVNNDLILFLLCLISSWLISITILVLKTTEIQIFVVILFLS